MDYLQVATIHEIDSLILTSSHAFFKWKQQQQNPSALEAIGEIVAGWRFAWLWVQEFLNFASISIGISDPNLLYQFSIVWTNLELKTRISN